MKKIIMLSLAVVMTTALFAQKTNKIVGINMHHNQKDTTRTFAIMNVNLDSCRYKLLKYWSNPSENKTGTIVWKNIVIPNLGKDLTITLTDGIFTINKSDATFKTFSDDKEKADKLKDLKKNQSRNMEITVTNSAGKNIIDDKAKTNTVAFLLEKLLQD